MIVKDKTSDLYALRHSAAHVMAQAVKRKFPQAKLAIGPPVEDGFYYDIDLPQPLTDADLGGIEAEMRKIIKENYTFEHSTMTKAEATKFFQERGEKFKLELIGGIADDHVSIYTDGDFIDLCEGPHVKSTGAIPAMKLLSIAGAYWRGDEHNPQLQRIYGTAFFSQEELDAFLKKIEEAKARDHRKLGKELGLYAFIEEAGPGMVFYPPAGAMLRHQIEQFVREEHLKRGYQLVMGPPILRADIWKRSGHLDYYKEYMYLIESEGQQYAVKPMNCPGHILIYGLQTRSYRELPLRFFELGNVCRNEKGGVLHGLLRVRGFTQDDAHIFLREEQLVDEIDRVVTFTREMLGAFGFAEFAVEISTRPAKFIGTPADWDRAESALKTALERQRMTYQIHAGEGAFYGPKIDIKIKDALGREWQCSTIQCDFALPERFALTYAGEDGKEHRPIMLHRAILGSLERFVGTLIEHYAGALPLWLSPVQAVVVPITSEQAGYAREVLQRLAAAGLRVEIDESDNTLNKRIRAAELRKVPYIVVAGRREVEAQSVAVRKRVVGDQGAVPLEQFVERAVQEVRDKR
ncbi:MAG: threonine--tRNA ligase [Candidatus Omnitrophica bacterium]|nr:threonine--tRNA ligase [Candidatus Omnitrophota bacterium]